MTANQLQYWSLQESKRHNQKTESQEDTNLGLRSELNQAQIARWENQTTTDYMNASANLMKGSASVVEAVFP